MQDSYEFASFRLDLKKRRLMCGAEAISLTPKEYDVLLFLLENSQRVVEKDELLEAVWAETYVEEGTLTRNISWLRKKLAAHDAEAKIIETVPKRGYRFLPEITKSANALIVEERTVQQIQIEEVIEIDESAEGEKFGVPNLGSVASPTKALPPKVGTPNFPLLWILPAALILAAVLFAAYRGYFSTEQPKITFASKIVPFSGLPGRENSPAFAPDGKQMVFSWDGGIENGNFDIYVKLIGAGEPIRLTSGDTDEINPVFAPDGKSVAFLRIFPTHNEIVLIPALGGAERKIYEKASYASLSFSPDGKFLAHAELNLSDRETGIFTINLQSGEKERITTPENPTVDHTPRFSPDGKNLAFIRYFSSFRREIFIVPATGGEPRQITSDDVRIYGLAWDSGSESLLFTSFRKANQLNLWKISTNGGEPNLISTGGKNLNDLAISPNGKIVAFIEETADENVWLMEFAEQEEGKGRKREREKNTLEQKSPHLQISSSPLLKSTRADHSQQFSPDGMTIVFASERTGNYEIWLAGADGKNQRQLTDGNGSAGSPRFSPDGKFIAFDAQTAGNSDIFVISVNGGNTRRLTENAKNNSLPAWSADGNWIFFLSNRAGEDQIWKMPSSGGEALQITKQGAFEMFAAPDGKRIIYSKGGGKPGLWSVLIDGSEEKPLPELADAGAWRSWTVAANGVYYTAFALKIPLHIKFYEFSTGQIRGIAEVDKPPLSYYPNLAVSADGKRLLYARQDQTAAGIMLAEISE